MKAVSRTKTALVACSFLAVWCAGAAPVRDYGQITLSFEANRGQAPAAVRYQARGGNGYTLQLADSGASMVLRSPDHTSDVLQMSLLRAASVRPTAEQPLEGRSNYIFGNDPNRWITGVPHYGQIRYSNVYPGVDWVYYGNHKKLEYDFVVRPGADPAQIRMKIEGAKHIEIDRSTGDLVLHTQHGLVRQLEPVIYQLAGNVRQPVKGRYTVAGSEIGFEVGSYDRSRTLVIDPVLAYWTYLGGAVTDSATSIAVDGSGNAYIAGWSLTGNQVTNQSQTFVSKINAAGTQVLYATTFGGSGTEEAYGVAVDSRGHAYVTGQTTSADFPMAAPIRNTAQKTEAFVVRLNEAGTIAYSTFLGGTEDEAGRAIAVDSAFNMYVTGDTTSTNFTGLNPATRSAGAEAFLIKIAASGTQVVYGVYAGGTGEEASYGIALDSNLNAYIAGQTTSAGIATPAGSFQTALSGPSDAFVAKFNTTGARVFWAYYGGTGNESARAVAVDAAGNPYITGATTSANLPRQNPYQNTFGGIIDAFAARLNAAGSGLVWSTYLGGNADDSGFGIEVLGDSAVVAGRTFSNNFPVLNSPQGVGGSYDGFVTQFASTGATIVSSSRVGGNGADNLYALAVDNAGGFYVAGQTGSNNVTSSVPGRTLQGDHDAFVAKLQSPAGNLEVNKTQLYYGVAAAGRTGGQPVQVTVPAGVAWTASSNQPHIQVTPSAGVGAGTITVSLDPAVNMPMANGTVTVTVPAGSSSRTVQVTIVAVANQQPIGVVDTPANNAANLYGAMNVTGWAVDNTEVTRISIWRNPLPGEPTHANGHIFIGDAVFLEGARPDVAAQYPTYPFGTRAGWGLQVLTNMLPSTNGPRGNGNYTFYVYAHDREGHATRIGSPAVSVNNAASTKPFGTIDRPMNGEEVSGLFTVWGWALTPQPGTIPTNGSTIWVYIDGAPVGHPVYNLERADIVRLFPGYNNTTGAVGYYQLDTTQMTNGMHRIAWSVTDNMGRVEGIGSRVFWVRNGTSAPADAPATTEELTFSKSSLHASRADDGISFRTGWDPSAGLRRLESSEITVEQGGRIELQLGAGVETVTFNGSRTLPEGSTFDTERGVFSWHLDIAYLDSYDLAFFDASGTEPRRVRVRVVTQPE